MWSESPSHLLRNITNWTSSEQNSRIIHSSMMAFKFSIMLKNLPQVLVIAHIVQMGACANTSSSLTFLKNINGRCDEDCEMHKMLRGRPTNELPEFRSSFTEDDTALLRASELVLSQLDGLHENCTISEVHMMTFATIAQAVCYSWIFSHRYDSYNDMRLAAGPLVNNEQCIGQLENLVARAEVLARERYNSTDVNLYQLMDTWGRISPGVLVGNTFVEGMYKECARLKIKLPGGRQVPTRYCTLSIRHRDWPIIDKRNVLGFQVGICIPKACDSSVHKNKTDLLIKLLDYRMSELDKGQFVSSNLYCLPDEDSPSRSILASPKATATVVLLASWLALLVYCTSMDHKLNPSATTLVELENTTDKISAEDKQQQSARRKMYEMLSINKNLTKLFSIGKASSLIERKNGELAEQKVNDKQETDFKIVDLSCIEGIKVLSMIYIIIGHVLMCLPTMMLNPREPSSKTSLPFYVANMAPAFSVNAFFTITGILNSYMMFKQNQSHEFMLSPIRWIAFFVYRYLRIMPVYALAVLYCKTLAKYTGSGPLWDYATSSLGQRRTCEQEPWSQTLLFTANFANPLTFCIPGGWYLANDLQFFLVTPFFLALLYKRPTAGQTLLCVGTITGMLAAFWSIISTDISDARPIASFAPHGFKIHVSHLSNSFYRPQYRIPAYLIGLLVGYKLYQFERVKLEFRMQAEAQRIEAAQEGAPPQLQEPDWPWYLKKFAIPFSFFGVAFPLISPLICFMIPLNKLMAHLSIATMIPLHHVLFASAVGSYLLIASTSNGTILAHFLSASCWKPLARLSLCALLVNVEVINYIIQGSTNMYYVSNQFHVALNCVCILATYLVSIVVCVLFEAPMRAALNALLTHAIKQFSVQVKGQKPVKKG